MTAQLLKSIKVIDLNQILKRSLAWLLSLVLFCSAFAVAVSAAGYTAVPTVYLYGTGDGIHADAADAASEEIYPAKIPEDFASLVLERARAPFLKGALSGEWEEFHRVVVDTVVELFGRAALDKNGEATDGSGSPAFSYTYPIDNRRSDAGYEVNAYRFNYDWRLDPFVNAAGLNAYIKAVCAASGAQKVNLIGRCLGANVVLAYLQAYGYSHVQRVCLYAAGLQGFEYMEALFSGEIELDPDAIPDYLDHAYRDENMGAENDVYNLMVVLLEILNALRTLDAAKPLFDSYLIPEFKQYILPEILRKVFATYPSYWSFIGEGYYDLAMRNVFAGFESEYAGLIEKAEHYHNDVMLKTDDLLRAGIAQGVPVYIIVKYGSRMLPVVKDAEILSDATVSAASSSCGATTAPLYGSFSDEFAEGIRAVNGGKYLSADRQIDASACLLPDHTWFIRNVYHHQHPGPAEQLIAELFNAQNYVTVFDMPQYPQYLVYDRETDSISPLAPDAVVPEAPRYSFLQKLIEFFRLLFSLLKKN